MNLDGDDKLPHMDVEFTTIEYSQICIRHIVSPAQARRILDIVGDDSLLQAPTDDGLVFLCGGYGGKDENVARIKEVLLYG